jgi:type I restriction enzyme S subunit
MEKQLIPKLRFPEFEGDWIETTINNILKIGSGRDYKHLNRGNIPVFGTGGFMTSVDQYLYDGESVFIGRKGTIDKPKLFEGKFWTVDTLFYTHSFYNSLPKFVFLLFQNINWQKYNEASGVPSLSKSTIEKIKVNIPELDEQKKITVFLTSVDERITLLTQQKEKLELYKKGVMQLLFSQQLHFKDENGKDFPNWEEKKLGEIGSTLNGLTGKTKEHFGVGKPYIQYMQVFRDSKIFTNEFGFVQINENENQSKVQLGDIFFTTSSETPNEIGTSSVLLDEVDEVYLNSFCFGFRPNSLDELVPEFAQFLFRSKSVRKEIVKLAQGSTRFNMSKIQFMKQNILLPCKEEQQKIASFLSGLDAQIQQVNDLIENTTHFKKGLLQQMFVL